MTISQTASGTPGALWTGRGLSALIVLFMIFDGVIKLPPLDVVTRTMVQLGWPADPDASRMLGIIGLVSTALYTVPHLGARRHPAHRLSRRRHRDACASRQPAVFAHIVRRLSRLHSVGQPFPAQSQGARPDPVQPIAATSKAVLWRSRRQRGRGLAPPFFDFGSNRPVAS